ncbi:MAG: hypothetical protein II719_02055 [Clostridia bacterium]|nr:hypothetical protein [Clostridia bacterium]
MIKQILKRYRTDSCTFQADPGNLQNGFLLRLRIREPVTADNSGILYEIPGTLRIEAGYLTQEEADQGWGRRENYSSYPDSTGNVPVLEASVFLDVPYHPDWTELKLGIPLAMFDLTAGDLLLLYDGLHLYFLYDGIVINENFPAGTLKPSLGLPVRGENLALIEFSSDIRNLECSEFERILDRSIHAYSPAGHSAWAGDVVNLWHNGVYHLFFLYDHHHHGNRWGCGVHYFYHMTTTDFVNWTDHGPIFEIEEAWQSFGTGTPFFFEGKFWFAVGFHTGRCIPGNLYSSHMHEFYREKGYTEAVSHEAIRAAGLYPNGANLAVSEDGGRTFHLTHQMFHWAENPSVYSKPDGTLFMCIGDGLWEADRPEGPWKQIRPGFPPQGEDTPLDYTAECPSFFEKEGYKYIIMGARGFWRTGKDSDDYRDCAASGEDIYDGLSVPMAVNCGGRLILSGWINGFGFGSVIIHRELIQYEDGRLGMKWLEEAAPRAEEENLLYRSEDTFRFETDPKESYYYEIDAVSTAGGVIRVIFDRECELRLDSARFEAQVGPVGGERITPIYERAGRKDPHRFDDTHFKARNFTIAQVRGIDGAYRIRISQFRDTKMNSTLIDAEIAGCRTILSNRPQSEIHAVSAVGENGAEIRSMSVYAYRMEECR